MAEPEARMALLSAYLEGDTDEEWPAAKVEGAMRRLQTDVARFRLEYACGMEEVATKINILRQEFDQTHQYKPIEHVKTRLKSMESLFVKAKRLGCGMDLVLVRERIRDIAGIRVVCTFVEDAYRVADMLVRQPDITLVVRKDYIAEPKANGYQSLHLIVEVPVFLSDRSIQVPVEVQIRTIAMDFWASIEHQIHYKYEGQVPEDLRESLLVVAKSAASLDTQMGELRDEVRSLAPHDAE